LKSDPLNLNFASIPFGHLTILLLNKSVVIVATLFGAAIGLWFNLFERKFKNYLRS